MILGLDATRLVTAPYLAFWMEWVSMYYYFIFTIQVPFVFGVGQISVIIV